MRAKCINIYNEHTKQYESTHHRLTIGKEYVVLEIGIYKNKILYRLIGDGADQSPILQNASQFEIISGRIPKNWELSQSSSCALMIGPGAWKSLGFWESCFDRDPEALAIYKMETKIIMEEEI